MYYYANLIIQKINNLYTSLFLYVKTLLFQLPYCPPRVLIGSIDKALSLEPLAVATDPNNKITLSQLTLFNVFDIHIINFSSDFLEFFHFKKAVFLVECYLTH